MIARAIRSRVRCVGVVGECLGKRRFTERSEIIREHLKVFHTLICMSRSANHTPQSDKVSPSVLDTPILSNLIRLLEAKKATLHYPVVCMDRRGRAGRKSQFCMMIACVVDFSVAVVSANLCDVPSSVRIRVQSARSFLHVYDFQI